MGGYENYMTFDKVPEKYLSSNDEVDSDTSSTRLSIKTIRQIAKQLFIKPDVVKGEDGKYYVSCCSWSDFNGMQNEVVEVAISPEGKVAIMKAIMSTSLLSCNCGVMF